MMSKRPQGYADEQTGAIRYLDVYNCAGFVKAFLDHVKMHSSDNFQTAQHFGNMHPREGKIIRPSGSIMMQNIKLLGLIPFTEQNQGQ